VLKVHPEITLHSPHVQSLRRKRLWTDKSLITRITCTDMWEVQKIFILLRLMNNLQLKSVRAVFLQIATARSLIRYEAMSKLMIWGGACFCESQFRRPPLYRIPYNESKNFHQWLLYRWIRFILQFAWSDFTDRSLFPGRCERDARWLRIGTCSGLLWTRWNVLIRWWLLAWG